MESINEGMVFTNQLPAYASYKIGDWTYGTPRIWEWEFSSRLEIGKFCSIADGANIMLGGEHRVDWVTTYPFNAIFKDASGYTGHPATKGDVVIGNDVWLARDVLILSGITIGDGAVVAAGSVVTKNVPPYAVVGGNPAKLIRYRFPPEQIRQLLAIQWWDWDMVKIKDNWSLLLANDIQEFIERHTE